MKRKNIPELKSLVLAILAITAILLIGATTKPVESDYERQERLIGEISEQLSKEKGSTILNYSIRGQNDGTIDIWIMANDPYRKGTRTQDTKLDKMGRNVYTNTWYGNNAQLTPIISFG